MGKGIGYPSHNCIAQNRMEVAMGDRREVLNEVRDNGHSYANPQILVLRKWMIQSVDIKTCNTR